LDEPGLWTSCPCPCRRSRVGKHSEQLPATQRTSAAAYESGQRMAAAFARPRQSGHTASRQLLSGLTTIHISKFLPNLPHGCSCLVHGMSGRGSLRLVSRLPSPQLGCLQHLRQSRLAMSGFRFELLTSMVCGDAYTMYYVLDELTNDTLHHVSMMVVQATQVYGRRPCRQHACCISTVVHDVVRVKCAVMAWWLSCRRPQAHIACNVRCVRVRHA
jgi:hypothetical protein